MCILYVPIYEGNGNYYHLSRNVSDLKQEIIVQVISVQHHTATYVNTISWYLRL